MRISQFIAACGIASRRAAELLVSEGKITVNGEVVTDLATRIDPETDEVSYRKRPLKLAVKLYYAVNKPVGYVCTSKDEHAEKLVIDLLPTRSRLYTVGRLDKDSEGLILCTNDGELTRALTHPSFELVKRYRVSVKGRLHSGALEDLVRHGLRYQDEFYRVKEASIKRRVIGGAVLNFTLTEGKNREIRKICEALDLAVRQLRRIEVAGIRLGKLPSGGCRKLTAAEVRHLQALIQGKASQLPGADADDDHDEDDWG